VLPPIIIINFNSRTRYSVRGEKLNCLALLLLLLSVYDPILCNVFPGCPGG
jgi:hypothetical protein